jgi:hypothetical protein
MFGNTVVNISTPTGWKCACCEKLNMESATRCADCDVERPKK